MRSGSPFWRLSWQWKDRRNGVSGKTTGGEKKKGNLDTAELQALSKAELIEIILHQRALFYVQIDEQEKRINELTEQLASLNQA